MNWEDAIGHNFGGSDYKNNKITSPVEKATTHLMERHHFITIEETKEIWYYDNGVYVAGGEITIEKEAQKLLGYKLKNKDLAEIKAQIIRQSYVKMKEIDADINTLNLNNGLYDIDNDRLLKHTPAYYSINQKPIVYDKDAKPKRFIKFLQEVLYPTHILTAIDAMAYTFHRDYIVEILYLLVGLGANGKSVFTKLLTEMHGTQNISNVGMKAIIDNNFALSDLEHKDVNIDNELSSQTINETAILKKLTGGSRQKIRIERKYQKAYDTYLYTKLFFNANKVPITSDNTDAYSRRVAIISFPNKFDGKTADKDLILTLTDEKEISGIFNTLMRALRRIRKNKDVYLNENTIEEKRVKYERAANPIRAFLDEVIDIETMEENENQFEKYELKKEDLYEAYEKYCKRYTLPLDNYDSFCTKIKRDQGYEDARRTEKDEKGKSKKVSYWLYMLLVPEYTPINPQKTLTTLGLKVLDTLDRYKVI
jgi:putative DNA primase/helicase